MQHKKVFILSKNFISKENPKKQLEKKGTGVPLLERESRATVKRLTGSNSRERHDAEAGIDRVGNK